MISVKVSASCGVTRCHITWVSEKPCSSSSGGPLPPTRAKMRPDLVLIHSEEKPGNRAARSGIDWHSFAAGPDVILQSRGRRRLVLLNFVCRCRWRVADICHPTSPTNKNHNEETCNVDRFRSPGRSQGDPRKSPQMGAGRMHPRREGTGHQAARRGAGQAAKQG